MSFVRALQWVGVGGLLGSIATTYLFLRRHEQARANKEEIGAWEEWRRLVNGNGGLQFFRGARGTGGNNPLFVATIPAESLPPNLQKHGPLDVRVSTAYYEGGEIELADWQGDTVARSALPAMNPQNDLIDMMVTLDCDLRSRPSCFLGVSILYQGFPKTQAYTATGLIDEQRATLSRTYSAGELTYRGNYQFLPPEAPPFRRHQFGGYSVLAREPASGAVEEVGVGLR